MDLWWWLPIGLVAWFALAVAVALWLGLVLRRCSRAREALDRQAEQLPASRTDTSRRHTRAS
jgi:hypothetical protein